MTEEIFVEQIAPIPDNDYFYYVQGELQVGSNNTLFLTEALVVCLDQRHFFFFFFCLDQSVDMEVTLKISYGAWRLGPDKQPLALPQPNTCLLLSPSLSKKFFLI